MTPWEKYQEDLTLINFQYDAAQENAVLELQRLYDELTRPKQKIKWRVKLAQKFGKGMTKPGIQGIYFYGGVGRGKTYLVDTFFECLRFEHKMHLHLHRFMHCINKVMKLLDQQSYPIHALPKIIDV